jgi:hypothetical protein
MGLYPIALDFGALGERIAASKAGTLLAHQSTPADINAAILAEIARAGGWPQSFEIGAEPDYILAAYYELPRPAGKRLPAGVPKS